MNFTTLIGSFLLEQQAELACTLYDFIKVEVDLSNSQEGLVRDRLLREARRYAEVLRGPPWNLEIETLVTICDNSVAWLDDISIWKNSDQN